MPISEYSGVVERLRSALASRLPGADAQSLMAARPPRPDWESDLRRIPTDTRNAAVLILMYSRGGKTFITLTRRTKTLNSHRSQISFPGGAMDVGETVEEGALREAQEEIALDPGCVEILGRLTPLHVPISSYLIHPLVVVRATAPPLRRGPAEVAEILEAPFDQLMQPEIVRWSWEERARGKLLIPYFVLEACEVWGATAMVLSELLSIFGWVGPPQPPEENPPD